MKISSRTSRTNRARRGAALVEFAVCLPVIIVLILGSLEMCNAIFLRQALAASAYETVRSVIKRNGTSAEAVIRGEEVLAARSIEDADIAFSPANADAAVRGEYVTVTVSAPFGDRAYLPSSLLRGRVLSSSATMVKE